MVQSIKGPEISLVIPVYQEGSHLDNTLTIINDVLVSLEKDYEIILIDDGSTDDTWSVIMKVIDRYPTMHALRFSRNFGKEAAISAGLESAKGDIIIVMDADLQHPPKLIKEMLRLKQETGANIVEAIKLNRGQESFVSRMRAKAFYFILSRLSGYDLHGASDYKLMDRQVVEAWLQLKERNLFFRGMSAWLGFKRAQVPFSVEERIDGHSSWGFIRLVTLALISITAFSMAPLRLITLFGLVFAVFATFLMIQTFYLKFIGVAIGGFTTVIILLLIIGSSLMIALGVIGEYIARIYDEVKCRPRYIISEKID